jgi:hypothetical protein
MKIVIDIPEELYAEYVNVQLGRGNGKSIVFKLLTAIKKGTPLPKGHGRLIDADDIDNHIVGSVDTRDCPTIIEADKECEE